MLLLCHYQLCHVEYFSPSETDFQPDPYIGGGRKYGPSEIQPSVGDAGAPVFSFRNNSENLQANFLTDKYLFLADKLPNAFLLGIVSLSQILTEQNQEKITDLKNRWSKQVARSPSIHSTTLYLCDVF